MTLFRIQQGARVGVVMLALLLAACASSGPAVESVDRNLSLASSAVSGAEEAGAQEHAPLALSQAQDKMRDAQEAKAHGDNAKALRLAEEAEVDAEFAEVKAQSIKTQLAVEELRKSIRTLHEEIERKQAK